MISFRSKDLMMIFLLSSLYIFVMSYPHHLNFNRSILEYISIILLILFTGYPLISFLSPEKNYISILKKPLRTSRIKYINNFNSELFIEIFINRVAFKEFNIVFIINYYVFNSDSIYS